MPNRISPPRITSHLCPRPLALGAVAAIAISATAIATSGLRFPGAVTVDYIPPDACVAFYGPGPCREHGLTILGSTDAIAGPALGEWQGKIQGSSPVEARP